MVAAEDKCRTTHNLTALSFTTASVAGTLSITTIAMNVLMLVVLFKGKRSRLRSSVVASGALINTIIADLATGILTDIIVTASHIIEGLQTSVRREILVAGHIVHFLTTGAALISVTLLSIDRIIAVMCPIYYQNSKVRLKTWHMFLLTWVTSSLFLISYFRLGFIKHLAVYASINITFPAILMILTVVVYREKFIKRTVALRIRTKSNCSQVEPIVSSPGQLHSVDNQNNIKTLSNKNLSLISLENEANSNSTAVHDHEDQGEKPNGLLSENTYQESYLPENRSKPIRDEILQPGQPSALQQLSTDFGPLLPEKQGRVLTRSRTRTSSVRFADEPIRQKKTAPIKRKREPFSCFFTKPPFRKDGFKRGHPHRISVEAATESSVTTVSLPGDKNQSTLHYQSSTRKKRRTDKRLMRALIINMCVFMLAYTPSISFIIYLNTCTNCNCTIVHILRDAVGLFVRSASLLRPLTFLICTKSLKEFLRRLRK